MWELVAISSLVATGLGGITYDNMRGRVPYNTEAFHQQPHFQGKTLLFVYSLLGESQAALETCIYHCAVGVYCGKEWKCFSWGSNGLHSFSNLDEIQWYGEVPLLAALFVGTCIASWSVGQEMLDLPTQPGKKAWFVQGKDLYDILHLNCIDFAWAFIQRVTKGHFIWFPQTVQRLNEIRWAAANIPGVEQLAGWVSARGEDGDEHLSQDAKDVPQDACKAVASLQDFDKVPSDILQLSEELKEYLATTGALKIRTAVGNAEWAIAARHFLSEDPILTNVREHFAFAAALPNATIDPETMRPVEAARLCKASGQGAAEPGDPAVPAEEAGAGPSSPKRARTA